MADYERLRGQVLAAESDGWRRGAAVLARAGLAAWITTWTAAGDPAHRYGAAAAGPQALPMSPTPTKGGESRPARGPLPPAATAELVAVLAAMTLAHAS